MIAQLDKKYINLSLGAVLKRLVSYFLIEGRPLTTSGRWINPFVRMFQKFVALFPWSAPNDMVFIMGSGRSGTTWLGKCLNLCRSTAFVNEGKIIWANRVANEDLMGSYQSETPIFNIQPESTGASAKRAIRRVYGFYAAITRANTVVEKYPELLYRHELLQSIIPGGKYLFIARSPFECVSSIAAWNERHAIKQRNINWWGLDDRKWVAVASAFCEYYGLDKSDSAKIRGIKDDQLRGLLEWTLSGELILGLQESMGERIKVLQYEMLSMDPVQTMAEVCKWLGLDMRGKLETYLKEATKPAKPYDSTTEIETKLQNYPVLDQKMSGVQKRLLNIEGVT